jgi:CheY-like chemotaxis protein
MVFEEIAVGSHPGIAGLPANRAVLSHVREPDGQPWRVLLVDDESDVHLSTEMSMRAAHLDGLPIVLERAHSASEAKEMLRDKSYALALLDIVMESQHAGLDLVRWIRGDAFDPLVRLVARTGQPGVAPELSILRDYDIVDYHGKALTASQVATMIRGQIRNYRDVLDHARQTWALGKLAIAYEKFIADPASANAIWTELASGASGLCRCEPGADRLLAPLPLVASDAIDAARMALALAGGGTHFDGSGTSIAIQDESGSVGIRFEGTMPVNRVAAGALVRALGSFKRA